MGHALSELDPGRPKKVQDLGRVWNVPTCVILVTGAPATKNGRIGLFRNVTALT